MAAHNSAPFSASSGTAGAANYPVGAVGCSDGLPVEFYIATWEHVGPVLLKLFNRILEGGTLTDDMKFGVITLLYKKGDKRNVRNWRPISRLNVSYKILAKLLARRLAPLLPGLVHTDQGAFVQGRSIFENVLMAMGALEIIQREDRQVMVAMLDLEKAYDRVNWSFVLATLQHMNFGPMFRLWVKELYTDSTAAVIVNGFVSPTFSLTRSLRQGCLLTSLLFAVQMEVLLNSLRAASLLRGLKLGKGEQLLTGAIADDLLLVTEATPDSITEAKSILDAYSQLSEAQVNWNKSVYFLPTRFSLQGEAWGMKRVPAQESERYLGVHVALSDARPVQDYILVAKSKSVLKRCRSAVGVSLFGRAILITSAGFAQLWYTATVMLISKSTLKAIRADAAKYLWKPGAESQDGYISKCAWSKVTNPRKEGGLGILDPETQNLALLGKWFCKVAHSLTQGPGWQFLSIFYSKISGSFAARTSGHVSSCPLSSDDSLPPRWLQHVGRHGQLFNRCSPSSLQLEKR
ncbi:hypothetical protein CBR_g34907 [Chara braunii]|uniref:Reverse transcriptase domain-containing protein n=1 Tax=Chara braunii TaxID=69332 RepID=A0A388LJV2_CHABU|nr:hypothetical protein CBR_g34907 [Chara braunii]|eukprot:GBG82531.1 hypothetical protein CBR_g34907 [Chara braunii]